MKIRKNYIFGLFLFDQVFEKITVRVLFEQFISLTHVALVFRDL